MHYGGKIKIAADRFQAAKEEYETSGSPFPFEAEPVDLYGGFVPFTKDAEDNLERTTQCNLDRFGLNETGVKNPRRQGVICTMPDFNHPEPTGIKDGDGGALSSFLTNKSYRGDMHIPIGGEQSVGDVSSHETGLGAYANKQDSIG